MTRSDTALLVDIEPIVQHRGTVSSCEIELCNMLDEKKKKRKNLELETQIAFKVESIMLFTYLFNHSIVSRLLSIDLSK